ncbi:MAG: hypothetical protein ACHQF2_01940 [Flavobacteriales bacterium]
MIKYLILLLSPGFIACQSPSDDKKTDAPNASGTIVQIMKKADASTSYAWFVKQFGKPLDEYVTPSLPEEYVVYFQAPNQPDSVFWLMLDTKSKKYLYWSHEKMDIKKSGVRDSSSVNQFDIFTLEDAEKILGEPTLLKDSSWTTAKETTTFQSSYAANSSEPATGKTGNIYFMIENHAEVSAAKKAYSAIKTANEKNAGIEDRKGLGDEAYFHSDGQNFYFMLVRKGTYMFRMKVNKITGNTSLNAFNQVAEKIAAGL